MVNIFLIKYPNFIKMIIKIIGDSSSSSIGEGEHTYGFKLFEKLSKKKEVSIFNYSTIGATSSDQCMYFHENIKNKIFDYLIIYLGNNESVYSTKKGSNNFFFWKLKNIYNFKYNYSNLNFLNEKFKFKDFLTQKKVPNTTKEFSKNIISIVRSCKKRKIKVILINPIANRDFLPSVSIENFEYLKFINLNEKIFPVLKHINEDSKKLIEGIKSFENLNYKKAKNIFEKLSNCSKNEMLKLISANNLAIAMYNEKKYDDAIKIFLNLLEKDKSEFKSIFSFNLSLIFKKINDLEKFNFFKNLSYNYDHYSYRIKEEYRETINKISIQEKVQLLDLKNILNQKNFIDPCHPNKDGHKKIANKLYDLISKEQDEDLKDLRNNKFNSIYINPDYFNNPKKSFYDYYFIENNIKLDEIRKNIKNYIKNNNCENRFITNFFKSLSKYPFISISIFDKKDFIPQSNELFSYPENFIHRYMYNLMIVFEKKFDKEFHSKYTFLKDNIFYKNIILKTNKNIKIDYEDIDKEISENLKKNIIFFIDNNISIFQNIVHMRQKTFMKWYTRETFRFGTVSSKSMLFDRVNLEILIESIIAFSLKVNDVPKIHRLFNLISSLIKVHKSHISQYLSGNNDWDLNYENNLDEIKKKIKNEFN